MKKTTKISIAIASLLVIGAANAAQPGGYIGGGLGASVLRTPNYFSNYNNLPGGKTSYDRDGLAGRIFAGYNINNNFGLEASLADYATSNSKLSSQVVNSSAKTSLYALSLVGKGYLPLADTGLNAYALAGLAEVRATSKGESNHLLGQTTPTNVTVHTNALRPTYGVGVSYDLPDNVTTNLEVSRIQGEGNMKTDKHALPNADLVSLNLSYNFG